MPLPGPGDVEFEFNVPIPGVILPQEQWARTALKHVPQGHLDWKTIFGREAPVILDIGCGNGRSLLHLATTHPEYNGLGIDVLPVVIRYATRRANQRGLLHTRWAVIGGRELLALHTPENSVSEIHCYHPQPWYRRDQITLRLITPEFLLLAHRALRPGGKLVLQTDHPGYWKYMLRILPVFFQWNEIHTPWPHAPKGITRREIIARQRGLPIFRGEGTARPDLDPVEAVKLAEALPLPIFNADRRLLELDRLEFTKSDQQRPQSARRPTRKSRQSRPRN
ncbi:MAG: tRNA ((7)-)-methyltransferase [Planctomycetota bacterium]|jgi:tRNA (guanine-N7-)-methyltransferase